MGVEIDPFHAISISRLAHELKDQGRSIIHMEFGQPSTGAPARALEKAKNVLASNALGYWESLPLKKRLCQHYDETYGVTVRPGRIAITAGASAALVSALTCRFSAGDTIAMARPGYVSYRNTVKALGMTALELDCGADTRFSLTADRIAALAPAPQGLILASPANPTGTIMSAEELEAIALVCRERDITIISDEIYHGLSYTRPTHSILEFEPEAFVINSFSKYFSMAGWRLGWLLSPESYAEKAAAYTGILFLTAPSLAQHAALIALDEREELEAHLDTYRRNRDLLLDALPKMGLDEIAPPDGAFYIYTNVERFSDDSMSLCKDVLRDTGVVLAPGIDFDPANGHRYIRISFAVSQDETREAIKRLKNWFETRV
ncbi:aminotransferase class I/II-fold pyridoxal phosphate-dependent enzyme [Henriciella sp.]|uniref:pyridoxal phosphate-dependent aminotransferase n=1 Tax=Henriciella sp. TaxID=1968823 RepID=UPI002629F788|nr:aminotransferase class I/II-fold pyridoxal phosphate-dependent enzyme [Henriciella sp.]